MSRFSGSARAVALASLSLAAASAGAAGPLTVQFSQCSEFVGLAPVDAAKAQAQDMPAALDASMEYAVTPPLGAGSTLYASVAPELGDPTRFFLDGSVNTPTYASFFLANWWRLGGNVQTRMQTTFPTIDFDFASSVAFTTNPANVLGKLTGTSRVTSFAVTYRGMYDAATMVVKTGP